MLGMYMGGVVTRRTEEVVDSRLEVKPSIRALKCALLVALRCVDPEAEKRPKMSQVVRMLEADEYPFREVPFTILSSHIYCRNLNLLSQFGSFGCFFSLLAFTYHQDIN